MVKRLSLPAATAALVTAAALVATANVPVAVAATPTPSGDTASADTASADTASADTASADTGSGPRGDRTSPVEAARVDRIQVTLRWSACSSLAATAECATVRLPLDYDQPAGPTTTVALLRLPAADPAHRIGTLFLNPGGPNGSGVLLATQAPDYLSQSLRDRFDIVGFDPRGTNFGSAVRCWKDAASKAADVAGLDVPVPRTPGQVAAAVRSSTAFGRACSTTGRPLSGAMSTAEVARDLDVLRRAVGDDKLTYLGFSYGSYLGNVYANMFPDRVRALTVDGVVDPLEWVGTPATRNVPMSVRMGTGQASTRALDELLARCRTAGSPACRFAAAGDPRAGYATLKAELDRTPVTVPTSGGDVRLDYQLLVGLLANLLYSDHADLLVDLVLSSAWDARHGDEATAAQGVASLTALFEALISGEVSDAQQRAEAARVFGSDATEYDNSIEAQHAVMCTDAQNPAAASTWAAYAAAGARTAPDFGPLWTWWSGPCAESSWTVRDEDAYRGPFTRRTAAPVLVVGNYWDPATKYAASAAVARELPNSRLLSSDSWGHTAYRSSACVTDAVDSYLLTRALPAAGTVCTGQHQPFASSSAATERRARTLVEDRWFTPFLPKPPGRLPLR